jgi:integrase/recombinase XerD
MNRTLARVAAELLDDPTLSAKTKKTYEGVLLPLVEKYGQTYVEEVQRSQIEAHLSSLIHVSYRTYNKHQTIITRLLNFAIERSYLTHNPISHLKRKKSDSSLGEHDTDERVRYFTKAELSALYTQVSRLPRLNALVTLLHDSGARIAEVLALNLQDVHFSEREFRVVGKGNKNGGVTLVIVLTQH